ncbi:MAG: hypothetical protein EOP51_03885 [Sphingobacteriales bacterium]|nr:MAG: hypothetical protein EOP51_03885 [Sphingobacteriales bacterium]
MIFLTIGLLATLLFIAWQDFKYRAVYWWLFIVLLFTLTVIKLEQSNWAIFYQDFLTNSGFLLLQILTLNIYFSIKQGKLINLFNGYFGLGDLFFLLAIAAYFSFVNYLLFYTGSLLIIMAINITGKRREYKIPLAGEQALLFSILLIIERLYTPLNLTTDKWLITYLGI